VKKYQYEKDRVRKERFKEKYKTRVMEILNNQKM